MLLLKKTAFLLLLGIIIFCPYPALGQLVIDPTGGTILFDDAKDHHNEVSSGRPLGFAGTFFGGDNIFVDVSTNGNINFSADRDFFNVPMPDTTNTARISGLWDSYDIKHGDGASIIEKAQAGNYYSVTWKNMEVHPGSSGRQTFQIAWFGADTTVKNFAFHSNDIAFSYGVIGADFANSIGDDGATIGLDKGDGNIFVSLPGTSDGLVTSDNINLIPVNNDEFVLFRPDGNDSYSASIEQLNVAPVPEASLFLSLAAMLLLLLASLRWRSIKGCY